MKYRYPKKRGRRNIRDSNRGIFLAVKLPFTPGGERERKRERERERQSKREKERERERDRARERGGEREREREREIDVKDITIKSWVLHFCAKRQPQDLLLKITNLPYFLLNISVTFSSYERWGEKKQGEKKQGQKPAFNHNSSTSCITSWLVEQHTSVYQIRTDPCLLDMHVLFISLTHFCLLSCACTIARVNVNNNKSRYKHDGYFIPIS